MKDCTELIKACPYITMDEYYFMKALAGKLPSNQKVVMIGAGPGELLLSFLEGYRYPNAKCTVIDKDTCEYVEAHILGDSAIDDAYVGGVEYIIGLSSAAAVDWFEKIDLLIVDGDHTYKGVRSDIQNWARFVRKYIWFHDYNGAAIGQQDYPDSRKLIDAYAVLAKWSVVGTPGCSIVYRVPKCE